MTLKYQNLETLMIAIKKEGYVHAISDGILEAHIARQFGISNYIIHNIKKSLVQFGFISPSGLGVWAIKEPEEPNDAQVEKKAEKEADQLLSGLK